VLNKPAVTFKLSACHSGVVDEIERPSHLLSEFDLGLFLMTKATHFDGVGFFRRVWFAYNINRPILHTVESE
jgi:hypothetical protein